MGSTAALLLSALFAPLPQSPTDAHRSDAVIVSGVVRDGRMPLEELGLGRGGLGPAAARAAPGRAGQQVTPGGALVRAQREGVKIDFPSGAELLLAPDGVVHLRDGGCTGRSLHALEIWLTDGCRVRAVRAGGRSPFREVAVISGGHATVLWRGHLALLEPAAVPPPAGTCYLALGDGDVLYEAAPLGPLLVLRRALCPRPREAVFARSRVVVAGDVLAASLRRLPEHVPPQPVQFPQAPQAAANLALAAAALFPAGHHPRPRGALGALVFPLAGDFRLGVEATADGPVWLGLYRGGVEIPVVEWRVDGRTTLHLVRPEGGHHGLPRYYLRGIDLTESTRALLPVPSAAAAQRWARSALRALGARAPAERAVDAAAVR